MKKTMLLFAAALVLAAVGCSKDETTNEDVKYVSEIQINFEGEGRISPTPIATGLKFKWDEGDMIKVYPKDATGTDYMQFRYDGTVFKGNTPATDKLEVGQEYIAVSSALSDKTAEGTFAGKLRNPVNYANLPMVTDVFVASSDATIATMHHIIGVIEVPVKAANAGTALKEFDVHLPSGTYISGDFTVGAAPSYTVTVGSTKYNNMLIQYDTPLELSTETPKSLYFPVFPCSGTVQIDYETTTKTGGFIGASTKTLTVQRGKVSKIDVVTLQ